MHLTTVVLNIIGVTLSAEAMQKFPPSSPSQQQLNEQVQEELQQQVINKLTPQLLNPETASVIGSPSAKYIMIVFIDNNCPACRFFYVNTLSKLMQTHPDLTVFIRQWAILGEASVQVAKGLLAAHRQGAFAPFHHQISTTSPSIPFNSTHLLTMVQEYAKKSPEKEKFNMAQFNKDLNSEDLQSILNTNSLLAQQIGLKGTPTILLGTPTKVRLMSSNSYDSLNDTLHVMKASSGGSIPSKS